jgi:hypothetical protein
MTAREYYLQESLPTPGNDIWMHLPMIAWLASQMPANTGAVELGVRSGRSTAAIQAGLPGECWHDAIDIHPVALPFDLGEASALHVKDSREAFGQTISFLFIDTEHTYEQVKAELAAWLPRCIPGAMVAGHDTTSFPDIARAYSEVRGLVLQYHNPQCNGMGVWQWRP